MNENIFSKQYKLLSTADLLDIIDKANDYQPLAVEAAQLELASRQLTGEEFNEARAELDSRQQNETGKWKKVTFIKNKITDFGLWIMKTYGPGQEVPGSDKYIMLISIFFGLYFLFQFFSDIGLLIFILEDGDWDLSLAGYFLHLLFIPVAGFLFWKREKLGWILVTIYSIYSVVTTIPLLTRLFSFDEHGYTVFDNLVSPSSPTVYITTLILFSGLLWILFKPDIRKIYGIGTTTLILIFGTGIILLVYYFFN